VFLDAELNPVNRISHANAIHEIHGVHKLSHLIDEVIAPLVSNELPFLLSFRRSELGGIDSANGWQ